MYFSLLKTNYLNSLHNINRKPFKKKKTKLETAIDF